MLNVLVTIALILVGIIALLLVLMAIPVEFAFDVQHDESSRSDMALVWLFGLVRIPLRGRAGKQRKKKPRRKTERGGQHKAVALLRNSRFRRQLIRYIRSLLRSIKIKTLDLQVRLGLDDPADTGRLWGILGPVSSLLAEIRQAKISIEPEFSDQIFSLKSHGRITVVPLRILSTSLRFFLSPSVIRALAFKS